MTKQERIDKLNALHEFLLENNMHIETESLIDGSILTEFYSGNSKVLKTLEVVIDSDYVECIIRKVDND